MPIIKSAKKQLRRSRVLRDRNLEFKIAMKRIVKQFKKELESLGDSKPTKTVQKNLEELLNKVYAAIDKAARRNIVNKNTAARKKSRLTAMYNKALGTSGDDK